MPSNAEIAKYIHSLAEGERALGLMGSDVSPLVAEILDFIGELIEKGAEPTTVITRLRDLSADLSAERAAAEAKADAKFGGGQ